MQPKFSKLSLALLCGLFTSSYALAAEQPLQISNQHLTVWAGMIGYSAKVTNPNNSASQFKNLALHLSPQKQASIINIRSISGITVPQLPTYNAQSQEYNFSLAAGNTIAANSSYNIDLYFNTKNTAITQTDLNLVANESTLNLTATGDGSQQTAPITIEDASGGSVNNLTLNFGQVTPYNLAATDSGVSYKVTAHPFASLKDQQIVEYDPTTPTQTVNLTFTPQSLSIPYQKNNYSGDTLEKIYFNISGAQFTNKPASVTLTNADGIKFVQNISLDSSGSQNFVIVPKDSKNYKMLVKINGYQTTNGPISFVANQSSYTANINLALQNYLVGYWADWGTPSLSYTASNAGYNMLVIAFGAINGVTANLGGMGPFTGNPSGFVADIDTAKQANPDLKILLSFGGANNSYKPGNLSDDQVQQLATSINSIVTTNHLDGVDFDIEKNSSTHLLHTLIQDLRKLNPGIIISGAPQLNKGADGNFEIVSTGQTHEPYYNASESAPYPSLGDFDYLFVQEYNTDHVGENDPALISESFKTLQTFMPANTRVMIGEPSTWRSASVASIFFENAQLAQTQANSRPVSTVGTSICTQVGLISQQAAHAKFGGIMVWDNFDDYTFNAHTATSAFPLASSINCVINGNNYN